jgi:hypothetical protein
LNTMKWMIVTAVLVVMGRMAGMAGEKDLSPGQVTRVACDLNAKPNAVVIFKGTSEDTGTARQTKDFHYDVYLPSDYGNDSAAFHPAMFIASPGGNAGMGAMGTRLKKDGWIVIMLVESKNGNREWLNNFLAAHDDAVQRFRIAPGAKFATGMSGGARCASMYPLTRPGFRGVVLQAAGFADGFIHLEFTTRKKDVFSRYPPHTLVAATFGDKDANLFESFEIRRLLPAGCQRHVEVFQGGHEWCPATVFDRTLDWIEDQAFLAKPAMTGPCRLLGLDVRAEPMSQAGYLWFFRLTQARAETAQLPEAKYRQLERLPIIARNGNLSGVPAVRATLSQIEPLLRELSLTPEVQELVKARQAHARAMQAYSKFETSLMRGGWEFRSTRVSAMELKDLQAFFSESGKVLAKYAESPEVAQLRCLNDSLKLEFSGPGAKQL